MPIGDIWCRPIEKVIKTCLVACSNAKYGCKQSTRYDKVANHEKLCVFAPCSCPVRNCNYVGSYKDLNNHFRATHKRIPGEIMSFVFNSPKLFGLDHNDDQFIFKEEKEGALQEKVSMPTVKFIGNSSEFMMSETFPTINNWSEFERRKMTFIVSLSET